MGAGAGNLNRMGDAQRQQAMESQVMRRRALQQQEQYAPTQEQVTPLETSAPQTGFGLEATPQPSRDDTFSKYMAYKQNRGMNQGQEMRSGVDLGPGRANRLPEQGSPEYEQIMQSVRQITRGGLQS